MIEMFYILSYHNKLVIDSCSTNQNIKIIYWLPFGI